MKKAPLFVSTSASLTCLTQTKACQRANKASPMYRLKGGFKITPHKKNKINSCSVSRSVRIDKIKV